MKSLFLRMVDFQLKAFMKHPDSINSTYLLFVFRTHKETSYNYLFPTMDTARSDLILTESNYSILYFTTF